MSIIRYLHQNIREDLQEKMVFIGGPRQVGKTSLAKNIQQELSPNNSAYLSWDSREDRELLMQEQLPKDKNFLILDEIHKYPHWRSLVKGMYDKNISSIRLLVTGSARLDFYRHGGDSLQGRYYYYRLHPFSPKELKDYSSSTLNELLTFGGFPEPFLKGKETHWKRWQNQRSDRLIQEDLISLEKVREISMLQLMISHLPFRVGSVLSINNLRQDLQVSFETVEKWIITLENLYYCFRISPWGIPSLRMAKKEKKLYLWDWSIISSSGIKLENMLASFLLKYCHFKEDTEGDKMTLHFMRDSEKREIDFLVAKNGNPIFAVECKSGDRDFSPHLLYYAQRTDIPIFFQVHQGERERQSLDGRLKMCSLETFCRDFNL